MLQKKLADIRAKRERGEGGFTLVELLVVVVILVALAAIAVPIFLNQATRAREGAAQSNLSAVAGLIKNGQSVGANVVATVATDTIAYNSTETGSQSMQLGDATVVTPAVAAGLHTITPTTNWCIQQAASGGNTYNMDQADTSPQVGTC